MRPVAITLGLALGYSGVINGAGPEGQPGPFAEIGPVSDDRDARLSSLAELRWRHRIILVNAETGEVIPRLQAETPAIEDRDILWFVRDDDGLHSNYQGRLDASLLVELDRQYFSRPGASVFLIGKDGGLKASSNRLALPALFARIDAMPMRQREMQDAR